VILEDGLKDESARLLALGDAAWTVEFGDRIDPALFSRVLGFAERLEKARKDSESPLFAGIVDVVPTFRSLSVFFDPGLCDGEELGGMLLKLAGDSGSVRARRRLWRIPVCFDEDFGPDLSMLAETKALSRDEVIALMTSAVFKVYMIGFMPGFPYMGGLPELLEIPRLTSPRKAIPPRTLAIAGAMCAIYPWESPGGWRLLGRTPVPLFSADAAVSPSLFASGDRVRFEAIDRARFAELEESAACFERSAYLVGEA
jgi:KipI family sensor histidine kinase inhibitor